MFLPSIVKLDIENEWSVFFYDHLRHFFMEGEALKNSVKHAISSFHLDGLSYKRQVLIEGANYLISYNSQKNEIRIGSMRLANEIFILDQIATNNSVSAMSVEDRIIYSELKKHIEEILLVNNAQYPGVSELISKKYGLVDLNEFDNEDFQKKTELESEKLLKKLNEYSPSLFEKVSDFALGLTANYALVRIHLLKFLAILPSLDHDHDGDEVKRILLESFRRLIVDSKKAKRKGTKGDAKALPVSLILLFYFAFLISKIIPAFILAKIVRFKVRVMAKRFIAGETIDSASKCFSDIFKNGRDVTLDQLGELVVSEKEADHYMNEVLKLVDGFSLHIRPGEKNGAGIYRAHVSIKVSALCSDFKPEAFDYTYHLVAPRLLKILNRAKEKEVFINIDAEHYHYRDVVFKIYKKILLDNSNLTQYTGTGIVLQAYLRDAIVHLNDIVELSKKRGVVMPIRLVKGAYWDAETIEADAHGTDAPEFLNKEETDINFRQIVYEIFKSSPHIQLALASHNYSDHVFAEILRDTFFNDTPKIEHQCLHMTYEALSNAMANHGWVTRNYVPIGSLIVGMAYLVRRIMENSSQVGVLTIMRSHMKKSKLVEPQVLFKEKLENSDVVLDKSITNLDGTFVNVAPLRTYLDWELESFSNELEKVSSQLPIKIEDTGHLKGESINVLSPSDNQTLVGQINFATREDALSAISTVDAGFYRNDGWSELSWVDRCSYMFKASEILHARRNELSAIIIHESGKSFKEALADVDEAIDFINFYIREQKNVESKINSSPRGPVAVIAPWNFPLAIPCGMVVSSLIAGNTVVLKPAEQTPLISGVLVNILHEAGIPKDALVYLPGLGEEVGQKLIEDQRISSIVFTGSKPVGVHISKTAAKRLYFNKKSNESYPVKVISEMGGKNALIVTNNAELDETVDGILYSAFAHAGQKCSALSRVLVDNKIKDKLIERLKEAALDIKVGKASDYSVYINPLVSSEEKQRVLSQVEQARQEASTHGGKVIIDRSSEDLPGNCMGPVLIELPYKRAFDKDSFSQQELFAPVVHIIGFDELPSAIKLFNSVDFGLTGGIFSQSQDDIDYCAKRFQVGNIYINRPITGARVSIEPFGGFKLSGTGPKAGGIDYIRALQRQSHAGFVNNPSYFEKGSSYEPRLSRSSGLNSRGRLQRVLKAIDEVIINFGPLFPGIFGNEKEKLQGLKDWLEKDFIYTLKEGRTNRDIPGQINYSLFNISKKKVVYLATTDKPHIDCMISFFMALSIGSGISIFATNQKSYVWWQYLIDILVKCGFSKRNIDCFLVDSEVLNKVDLSLVDLYILDANEDGYQKVMEVIEKNIGQVVMPKVLSTLDEIETDFLDLFCQFNNERSFAINTMRHGAPMELQ